MENIEEKGMHDSNLILELELRIACNLVINFCLYNNSESVKSDFTRLDYLIEETCLMAIKASLNTQFVPARKVILIFHIYIRFMFGERKTDPKHKKFYSNLRYIKDLVDYRNVSSEPRYNLNSKNKVE